MVHGEDDHVAWPLASVGGAFEVFGREDDFARLGECEVDDEDAVERRGQVEDHEDDVDDEQLLAPVGDGPGGEGEQEGGEGGLLPAAEGERRLGEATRREGVVADGRGEVEGFHSVGDALGFGQEAVGLLAEGLEEPATCVVVDGGGSDAVGEAPAGGVEGLQARLGGEVDEVGPQAERQALRVERGLSAVLAVERRRDGDDGAQAECAAGGDGEAQGRYMKKIKL